MYYDTKWWVFNQYLDSYASFSFALAQALFQHTLPTNLGRKDGRMSAALFSQSFLEAAKRGSQRMLYFFQLQQQKLKWAAAW